MATWPSAPSPEQFNFPRISSYATCLATSAATTGLTLSGGYLYVFRPDHNCHWKQGPAASGAASQVTASTSDEYMPAGSPRYIWITSDATGAGDDGLSFKSVDGSGGGKIYISRVVG